VIRRLAVPLLLVAIAVAAGFGAVVADAGGETAEAAVEIRSPVTPLLSARRVPDHITEDIADDRLTASLTTLAAEAPPDTCLVVDAGGRTILDHHAGAQLIPASNEKLLVAAAALEELGPRHRFRTSVVANAGPNRRGVVVGDLWLVGGGDPVLASRVYADTSDKQDQAHTRLEDLADAVVDAGVQEVRGRIVGDDTRFDATRYVDAWPSRFIDQQQTGPLSALSVNDGFGTFPTTAVPSLPQTTSTDPPRLAAAVLADLLTRRGVRVTGGTASGRAPRSAQPVAEIRSAPLRDITGELLTWSDNQTAELVLKELGVARNGEGSTASGAAAVEDILTEAGFDLTGVDVVDGSGLAGANRVTCAALHEILAAAGPHSTLVDSLAIAGRSGTLAELFVGTPAEGRLRAKTGSLNEARALSGVVRVPDGDDLTFSLLVNQPYITEEGAAVRVDVGLALAAYPQRPDLDRVGPRPLSSGGG
jgi:serine-type D-Ala-D-Ala carboxypeptidase/endopeptidase (penicillin-binding protein 4)